MIAQEERREDSKEKVWLKSKSPSFLARTLGKKGFWKPKDKGRLGEERATKRIPDTSPKLTSQLHICRTELMTLTTEL